MPDWRLTHAVTDLKGKQLLAAETCLTGPVMQALVSGRPVTVKSYCLLDSRQVRSDLSNLLTDAPYDVILQEKSQQQTMLDIAGEVMLPGPSLDVLHYFREADFYTYCHSLRVFALSILICLELIDERQRLIQEIGAGPTHDIGKLCVPIEILTKQTPLTNLERDHLRHHALAGYVLLSHHFQDPAILVAEAARDHHERRDASGYPLGIRIDNRKIDIIMVSDIYDALTSPRPYRPVSYDNRSALEELTRQAEAGLISKAVVRALIALNRRSKPHYSRCVISSERRGTPPADNVYGKKAES